MPELTGYHHVNLSVPDATASARWYGDVLGLVTVREGVVDGMTKVVMTARCGLFLGLTGHGQRASGDRFSEFRTGLDHVALAVADRAALDAWAAHLDAHGVEHSGINASLLGEIITLRDPDNTQIELFAPYPASNEE